MNMCMSLQMGEGTVLTYLCICTCREALLGSMQSPLGHHGTRILAKLQQQLLQLICTTLAIGKRAC